MIELKTDRSDLFRFFEYFFDFDSLNSSKTIDEFKIDNLKGLIQIDPYNSIGQFWTGLREITSKPNNPTTVFLGGMVLVGAGTLLVLKTPYPPLQAIGGALCLLGTVMFFSPKVISETLTDLQNFFAPEPPPNTRSS